MLLARTPLTGLELPRRLAIIGITARRGLLATFAPFMQNEQMTFLAQAMLWVFVAAWCVALASWLYAARYFVPWWGARFRGVERPLGHLDKASRGCGVFVLAILVGFLAGAIAQFVGGGWE